MKTIEIDRQELMNRVHARVISDLVKSRTGCNFKGLSKVIKNFGISLESHRESVNAMPAGMHKQILTGFLNGLEAATDDYYSRIGGVKNIRREFPNSLAMEAAEEELTDELETEESDGVGDVVVDIIKSITERNTEATNETIRDVSKMILEMEKDKQEEVKDALLKEENEGNKEENVDDDTGTEGDGGDETGDTKGGSENSNPFDDGSEDNAENPKETGGAPDSTGNPFDGDAEPNGDNDDSTPAEKTGDSDNENNNDSDASDNKEANVDDDKNPFGEESMFMNPKKRAQIAMESIGGPGRLSNMALVISKGCFQDEMEETFHQFGVESEQYKSLETKYIALSKDIIKGVAGLLSLESVMNFRLDRDAIKHPEIFFTNN